MVDLNRSDEIMDMDDGKRSSDRADLAKGEPSLGNPVLSLWQPAALRARMDLGNHYPLSALHITADIAHISSCCN